MEKIMRYAKINSPDELVTVKFQEINPQRCPHLIFVGEHYRADGSCKCNDQNETVMREWGYHWSKKNKQWS